jgi:hypothetical protein
MTEQDAVEILLGGVKYILCPYCKRSDNDVVPADGHVVPPGTRGCLVCYKTRKVINPEYERACRILKVETPDDPGEKQRKVNNLISSTMNRWQFCE